MYSIGKHKVEVSPSRILKLEVFLRLARGPRYRPEDPQLIEFDAIVPGTGQVITLTFRGEDTDDTFPAFFTYDRLLSAEEIERQASDIDDGGSWRPGYSIDDATTCN